MPEALGIYGLYAIILLIPFGLYVRKQRRKETVAKETAVESALRSDGPRAQHPHIDVSHCIGCQGCTAVCPEGDVLGMVGGKAAVVRPYRCIGHGLCAEACPVGAITMRTAAPGTSADLPHLTEEYETSVPNLFIAGELGGLALIRNAVDQGRRCIDIIAGRIRSGRPDAVRDAFDVLIVGAGPAGISASLRAIELGLNYATVERETIGGTVAKYPRQKMVMSSRVEFPIYGPLRKMELSKEDLLAFLGVIEKREDFRVHLNESVESVFRDGDGILTVTTGRTTYRARNVILAMGRSGTPRKLGVPGEDLPKVMYRLLEADHYVGRNILVVGGGDSAVEAALGLARQKGNRVTLSYRGDSFVRVKGRNVERLNSARKAGALDVVLKSVPVEITEDFVVLDVHGERREIPNDFVWVFAGGAAPNAFLEKAGIAFGARDLTNEVGRPVGADFAAARV